MVAHGFRGKPECAVAVAGIFRLLENSAVRHNQGKLKSPFKIWFSVWGRKKYSGLWEKGARVLTNIGF